MSTRRAEEADREVLEAELAACEKRAEVLVAEAEVILGAKNPGGAGAYLSGIRSRVDNMTGVYRQESRLRAMGRRQIALARPGARIRFPPG